jgi:hypothetical protein
VAAVLRKVIQLTWVTNFCMCCNVHHCWCRLQHVARAVAGHPADSTVSCAACGFVVTACSKDVQGVLSDAAGAIEKLLPLPEIEEMRALIEATINGTLDILQVRKQMNE